MNKKKWTIAGEILAARGEKQNDVMDIFQVTVCRFESEETARNLKLTRQRNDKGINSNVLFSG